MNNQVDSDGKDKFSSENQSITPSGEAVLMELGIDAITIKTIKPLWRRNQYRAIINWLTKYKSQLKATNLEQIKGYLEAFYHLCRLEFCRTSL
ncbi:MAG: hypothetical protein SAL70_22525 [Scytonema sp. PMC 1070.18]|nr:hypothetical protein [Scytonema sp. PMC 1070.18]